MALRLIQFLSIMLTALALVPSGAHLAALPNKMAMAQAAYFVAQQIYAGWALFGIVLFGALAANLAHTKAMIISRHSRPTRVPPVGTGWLAGLDFARQPFTTSNHLVEVLLHSGRCRISLKATGARCRFSIVRGRLRF